MTSRLDWSLKAVDGVIGAGPRWIATSDEPWLEVEGGAALAGRWVELVWSAGLWDRPCRPILRCMTPAGDRNVILPAAPFGVGRWAGRIVPGTTAVRISPVDASGPFGFRLDTLTVRSVPGAIWAGLRRKPLNAITAVLAGTVGLKVAADRELSDALVGSPLAAWDSWRRAGTRQPDTLVDGERASVGDLARVLWLTADPDAARAILDRGAGSAMVVLVATASGVDLGDPSVTSVVPETPLAAILTDLADHDLVAIVPTGTVLEPLAAEHLVATASSVPTADWFYGDEVVVATGEPPRPMLRQGFDPMLAASLDYFGAVIARRRRAMLEAGLDGTTLGDLVGGRLRAAWVAGAGYHVARVLARSSPAVAAAVHRRIDLRRAAAPSRRPKVSIVIPTRDRVDLLSTCIGSIEHFDPAEVEIVVVDNGSVEPKTAAFLDRLATRDGTRILRRPIPFNYSRLCNDGAAEATGSLLVFLNNDTEFRDRNWLGAMATHALRSDVGAVGIRLLYPNGRLQHGGVVLGSGGRAGHVQIGIDGGCAGYFGRFDVSHRVSAITGACLMVERDKFEAVGGFDAENLPVDLNDIDLCLRLEERGLINVYVGEVAGIHNESASRGRLFEPDLVYASERRFFEKRWLHRLRNDPFFNPALSLATPQIELG